MISFLFDSRNPKCKTPFGALATEQEAVFQLYLPISYQLHSPVLLLYKADLWNEPAVQIELKPGICDGVSTCYKGVFSVSEPQLYFYLFEATGVNGQMRVSRNIDGFGKLSPNGNEMWQLTVYDKDMHTPDFLKSGIMYQIFPDRFCDSGTFKENVPTDRFMHGNWYDLPEYKPDQKGEITNSDYFGGDLAGITEKLPYIKSLGVSTIYLNPIFEAHSNHRYNTADYLKIDPMLGTEEDFVTLCMEAKKLDIHILLDGVFNHSGSDSVYFNKNKRYGDTGAYNDPNSPYCSWYNFNNYPDDYESWWGVLTLPSFNENDKAYSEFICGEGGVLEKWINNGASGFRLDVADELPDAFLDKISARIKSSNPQAAVIGEVWEDASTKVAYGVRRRYFLGKQLDSVMNYPFKDSILSFIRYGNCMGLYDAIMSILEHYPKPVLNVLMNSLSTHDVERAITVLAGEPVGYNGREWQWQNNALSPQRLAHGKRLLKLASILQFMLPGIPCVYYGDEAGLFGYKDPFNRTCYPWDREDLDLLEFFRSLGRLRVDYPALSSGDFTAVSFTPEVVAFTRDCGNDQFFIAVNRSDSQRSVSVPEMFIGASPILGAIDDGEIAPYGWIVLHKTV